MIHHVSFGTNGAERARAFYDPVISVLGIGCMNMRDGFADRQPNGKNIT